jgi:hypothetical protein
LSIHAYPQVRYLDSIFTSVKKTEAILYVSNLNYVGLLQNLFLDFYEPVNDSASKRPLMIWVNGGAFTSGDRNNEDIVYFCNEFAKKGYATASIDYRTGLQTSPAGIAKAAINTIQDLKAAIRYFRSKKDEYKIDTSRIICGGTSAGAFIAIHAGYLNANEIPVSIDLNGLGGIDGNSGNQGYSSRFHLIINGWGAICDTNWINAGDIPIVSIHGTSDATVPCFSGNALGVFPVFGSAIIERVASRLGIPNRLKLFYGIDHQLFGGTNDQVKARFDTSIKVISEFVYSALLNPGTCNADNFLKENEFKLFQNFPNPFNPSTVISYQLPVNSNVTLIIYNLLGQKVKTVVDEFQNSGFHSLPFTINSSLPSGIYFYQLIAGNFSETRKLVVVK